jgi:hypothetical protein
MRSHPPENTLHRRSRRSRGCVSRWSPGI